VATRTSPSVTFLCADTAATNAARDFARRSAIPVTVLAATDRRKDLRRLELHNIGRLRAAASHARRVFPGPVGAVLARELEAHAELGYQVGPDALLSRLATEILRM
jgi:hypothetical protein